MRRRQERHSSSLRFVLECIAALAAGLALIWMFATYSVGIREENLEADAADRVDFAVERTWEAGDGDIAAVLMQGENGERSAVCIYAGGPSPSVGYAFRQMFPIDADSDRIFETQVDTRANVLYYSFNELHAAKAVVTQMVEKGESFEREKGVHYRVQKGEIATSYAHVVELDPDSPFVLTLPRRNTVVVFYDAQNKKLDEVLYNSVT